MRQILFSMMIAVLLLATISCAGRDNAVSPVTLTIASESDPTRDSSYLPSVYCGEATVASLIAGQNTAIGKVIVTNDDQYLYVEFIVWVPWVLVETHVAVSDSLDGIPQTKTGNPKVGQFGYTIDSWINLIWPEDTVLYVAAHADVQKLDENGQVVQQETAWGKGEPFPGNNWAMYFNHTVQSCILDVPISGWAKTWGGSGEDNGYSVATDKVNNTYVTGRFHGTVDFDPGLDMDNHTSNGGWDSFLTKFDSSGTLLWTKTWGGGQTERSWGVATDILDNVYVTGHFYSGIVDFDPSLGVDNHTSNGGPDIFLSKFDSSGNYLWARTWGGAGSGTPQEDGWGVVTDISTNVYVTGHFNFTVDFDPGPGEDNHTSNGNGDVFLSKLDPSGSFLWAKTWGGGGYDFGWDIAADSFSNVYVTGDFYFSTVDFDPGSNEDWHAPIGGADIFLSKFDSSGNYLWARTWGGAGSDRGRGVAVDGSNDVFVTGYFYSSTVDFDPGFDEDWHTSNGLDDIFLNKFSSLGDFLWAKTWGGSSYDDSYGVATDNSDNAYVTGNFQGTVDFDPGPGEDNHTSNGSFDAFLSKFLPDGSW